MGSSGGLYGQEVEGTGDVVGPSSATDNALARFDSTTGKLLQNGVVTESDAGALAGITQLDADNLRLDGNTLSITNVNGDAVLAPNGAGQLILVSDLGLQKKSAGQLRVTNGAGSSGGQVWAERLYSEAGGNAVAGIEEGNVSLAIAKAVSWTNGSVAGGGGDTGIRRDAAAVTRSADGVNGGFGSHLCGRVVEASTAGSGTPNLLASIESRKLITNEGAGAEAYNTLPASAPVGYEQLFYCKSTSGIRIAAPSGCTIRLDPSRISAAAGFVRSVVEGSGLVLTKINATEFVCVVPVQGTWTVDV